MVQFVENESLCSGYRVARGESDCLGDPNLRQVLVANQIDVLKLSIANPAPDLYLKLHAIGFPFYILGILQQYKSTFNSESKLEKWPDSIHFAEYANEDPAEFKSFVSRIFKRTPGSHFINPGLTNIQSPDIQLTCLSNYISTLNRSFNKDHFTHILYYEKQPVGFICSYKKGLGGGVSYAGLLPEYHNRKLYPYIIAFIKSFGTEIGQQWGTALVQIQQTVAQKAYVNSGMKPDGYQLNIHVNSFQGVLKVHSHATP